MNEKIKLSVILMILTLLVFSSGCLEGKKTTATTITRTTTVYSTNTIVKDRYTTITTTLVSYVFESTTVYSVETTTLPITTTVYISSSETIVTSNSPTQSVTIIEFGNSTIFVRNTVSGTLFITLPQYATVLSPEIEFFTGENYVPAYFELKNYPTMLVILNKYNILPLGTPVVVSTMALEYFAAAMVKKNASVYGRATLVKIVDGGHAVGEYVILNNVYYGFSMTYHPYQFSAIMYSLHPSATLYYLVVDNKCLPMNVFTNTLSPGTPKGISFSTLNATIGATTISYTDGKFTLIYPTTTKAGASTLTTTTTLFEPVQSVTDYWVLYPFYRLLGDYYMVSNHPAYGYISVGQSAVAQYTLVAAGGRAFYYYATMQKFPDESTTITGIVILS